MKKTGSQIIWETMLKEGVHTVFGYPGGSTINLYDEMLNYPVRHVLSRHEQGSTHMADGFARAGGGVGVAISTSGPGATNMVTGIATAMMDSSPMVCISGQVGSRLIGYDAFQETDVTGVTMPITKHNYLVTDVRDLSRNLREAFYIAQSGRPGPVLLDIPKDVTQASIEWAYDDSPIQLPGYRPDYSPLGQDLQNAVEMISNAKKPIILAGRGVLLSGAMKSLKEFAEKTQTPVAMTLLGIGGFPASHPLNLGMMGMHGEAWVNDAIQDADLLLAFGMRFDDRVTGSLETYGKNAKKIHIDIDPSEVHKIIKVDQALIGDLNETLVEILPHVEPANHSDWLEYIDENKRDSLQNDILNRKDIKNLHSPHVIHDLWKTTQGKALIVTDVGQNQMWAAQYYHHDEPNNLITSGGLGTMGFALPAAIGAKVARPEKEVWVIAGDGGFQMTQAELQTAAQENIKVNIAILNNGYLGMVRQWQEFFFDERYAATPMTSPDFVKIADAHGLKGFRVTEREDVESTIQKARETDGTVLIDFRVEGLASVFPMVPTGKDLKKMIRRPKK
ncbi:MAG: biosynthetic-type acetolactate synthase large subunit [Anaerolineaceae bacterium]|nr:biosynthetic-type acetolactate synthase large subunit [Anaerolineaceae bacterium]